MWRKQQGVKMIGFKQTGSFVFYSMGVRYDEKKRDSIVFD